MSPRGGQVRIGPISLFTLISVICLAVLAVLAITTADASYKIAELQAESTNQQYIAESAAQQFLGAVDQEVSDASGDSSTRVAAVDGALDDIVAQVQESAGSKVTVAAQTSGDGINAQFACKNGRVLDVEIAIQSDGTYEIAKWEMTATENEAQSEDLWSGM